MYLKQNVEATRLEDVEDNAKNVRPRAPRDLLEIDVNFVTELTIQVHE